MAVNIFPGPYSAPATTFHQPGALYNKVIRVTASTNNPLTLTGSFANNVGFIVMATGSGYLYTKDGTSYISGDFHSPGTNHVIYPIELSYVSCSNAADISVLYHV
jgi:hypothetical protein